MLTIESTLYEKEYDAFDKLLFTSSNVSYLLLNNRDRDNNVFGGCVL